MENITKTSETTNSNDVEIVQLTKIEQSAAGEEILSVDMDAVNSVLGNPKYKDYPVAVYTIAGPTRTGKSFFLSLFRSFLLRDKENNDQWTKNEENVKDIFKWKKGAKSYTQGMYILKEPFIACFEDKVTALFLVDNQGMFDHSTSVQNQSFLGTFNFLLSSFLIFNVQNRIDPTHLESVVDFATNMRGSDGNFVMAKESLMFVVRDWSNATSEEDSSNFSEDDDDDDDQNFSFGMEGGKSYFQTVLGKSSPHKAKEHKLMREHLNYAFGENISCCLLPYPGEAVRHKSCSLINLDDQFQKECTKFFRKLKNKGNFKTKEMQNKPCTCEELREAIKDYVSQLGPQLDVSDCSSFLLNDFKVKMSSHIKTQVNKFVEFLNQRVVFENTIENLEKNVHELEKTKDRMSKNFAEEVGKFYPQKLFDEWQEELVRVLSQIIRNWGVCMRVRLVYREAILEYATWIQSEEVNRLRAKHHERFSDSANEKRDLLLKKIAESISQHVKDTKLSKAVFSQFEKYFLKHTNKLTAAIDHDISTFLTNVEKARFTFKSVNFGAMHRTYLSVDSASSSFDSSQKSPSFFSSITSLTKAFLKKIPNIKNSSTEKQTTIHESDRKKEENSSNGDCHVSHKQSKKKLCSTGSQASSTAEQKKIVTSAPSSKRSDVRPTRAIDNTHPGESKLPSENQYAADITSGSSFRLQQYEEAEMKVEFLSGTIVFPLEAEIPNN